MKQKHQTVNKTTRGTKEARETIKAISKSIGNEIKALRLKQDITRSELAKHLDVTLQQIQKYEQGKDNISVGRLALIAKTLGTNINYLYKSIPNEVEQMLSALASSKNITTQRQSDTAKAISDNVVSSQTQVAEQEELCHEVATNFMKISNAQHQKAVNLLVKSLSKTGKRFGSN